jgi:hypothetical protein
LITTVYYILAIDNTTGVISGKKELLSLPEHQSSLPGFGWVRVALRQFICSIFANCTFLLLNIVNSCNQVMKEEC